jgi:hypothetical protein
MASASAVVKGSIGPMVTGRTDALVSGNTEATPDRTVIVRNTADEPEGLIGLLAIDRRALMVGIVVLTPHEPATARRVGVAGHSPRPPRGALYIGVDAHTGLARVVACLLEPAGRPLRDLKHVRWCRVRGCRREVEEPITRRQSAIAVGSPSETRGRRWLGALAVEMSRREAVERRAVQQGTRTLPLEPGDRPLRRPGRRQCRLLGLDIVRLSSASQRASQDRGNSWYPKYSFRQNVPPFCFVARRAPRAVLSHGCIVSTSGRTLASQHNVANAT